MCKLNERLNSENFCPIHQTQVVTLSVRRVQNDVAKMCVRYLVMPGMGNSHLPAILISTICIAICINSMELFIVCMHFNIVCMHYGEQFTSILPIWSNWCEFSYFWVLIY
jgi:hypothetical protein